MSTRQRETYGSGAWAQYHEGTVVPFRVAVPADGAEHPATVRAHARKFARSVWGPSAEIGERIISWDLYPSGGGVVLGWEYGVVIGDTADARKHVHLSRLDMGTPESDAVHATRDPKTHALPQWEIEPPSVADRPGPVVPVLEDAPWPGEGRFVTLESTEVEDADHLVLVRHFLDGRTRGLVPATPFENEFGGVYWAQIWTRDEFGHWEEVPQIERDKVDDSTDEHRAIKATVARAVQALTDVVDDHIARAGFDEMNGVPLYRHMVQRAVQAIADSHDIRADVEGDR